MSKESFMQFWRRQGNKRRTLVSAAREAWNYQARRLDQLTKENARLKGELNAARRQPMLVGDDK